MIFSKIPSSLINFLFLNLNVFFVSKNIILKKFSISNLHMNDTIDEDVNNIIHDIQQGKLRSIEIWTKYNISK